MKAHARPSPKPSSLILEQSATAKRRWLVRKVTSKSHRQHQGAGVSALGLWRTKAPTLMNTALNQGVINATCHNLSEP